MNEDFKEIVIVTSKGKFAFTNLASATQQIARLAPVIVEAIYEREPKVYSREKFPEIYA